MSENPTDASDQGPFRALFDQWHDAIVAEDIPALMGMLTDDAMILAVGTPTIDGKDAIRSMYETTFPIYSIKQELTIEEWEASGDLAFVRGEEEFSAVPKQPDLPPHAWPAIRTLTLLRRVQGEWRIARAMSNLPQAAPATPEGDSSA